MTDSEPGSIWGVLRISMGWLFLWPFLDKLFGLGFATPPEKSWPSGASPAYGFLTHGTKGPLAEFYQGLAGNALVDCLYMGGLLLIGLALILGIGTRIAGYSGALMMLLIYSAMLFPKHNPFLDHHIIYVILLVGLAMTKSGHVFGFGKSWSETRLVQKYPFLE